IRDWQWEISTAVLSLACTIAVFAVLLVYQGKPTSEWKTPHGITLNTLVAILSTLGRGALLVPVTSCISQLKWLHFMGSPRRLHDIEMFDEASRGPWGAFTFLWRLRLRSKLAAWGSLIMVLSTAVGPFTQQLITYPVRSIHHENAELGVAHILDSRPEYKNHVVDGSAFNGISPKLQSAIYSGLYNLGNPVQFTCPFGNCRWNAFSTLGVASKCRNSTIGTHISCEPRHGGNVLQYCNYTTPNGFLFNIVESGVLISTAKSYNDPSGISPMNSTILELAVIKVGFPIIDHMPPRVAEITECELRWCATTFLNASVVNGTFHPGPTYTTELALTDTERWFASSYNFKTANDEQLFGNPNFTIGSEDDYNIKSFLAEIFSTDSYKSVGIVLRNSSSFPDLMANISRGLTYAIGSNLRATTLLGNSTTTEQFVSISWPWIALPMSEAFMGILFLISTILVSKRRGVTTWKSSSILPLLIQVEGWEKEDLVAASLDGIERKSKRMHGLVQAGE
ncbi:uncharacterized protein K452DRAFT_199136, partial [Aplosporella prunicola CBS 121167]